MRMTIMTNQLIEKIIDRLIDNRIIPELQPYSTVDLEVKLDWRPPSNEAQASPRSAAVTRRRCAVDNVIVMTHCNAQWDDNFSVFHPSGKVKVLAPAGEDLSADNQNSR